MTGPSVLRQEVEDRVVLEPVAVLQTSHPDRQRDPKSRERKKVDIHPARRKRLAPSGAPHDLVDLQGNERTGRDRDFETNEIRKKNEEWRNQVHNGQGFGTGNGLLASIHWQLLIGWTVTGLRAGLTAGVFSIGAFYGVEKYCRADT